MFSLPQKTSPVPLHRRGTFVRILAFLCVLELFINLAPEVMRSLPSLASDEQTVQAQSPTPIPPNAIVVGEAESDNTVNKDECNKNGIDDPTDDDCDLGDAIALANYESGADTIVFRNNVTTVQISANTPKITTDLTIDGTNTSSAGKVVFAEHNTTPTIDYFLLIQDNQTQTSLSITIKNIAFTNLRNPEAVAITTRDAKADTYGAVINELFIKDNFFGTTDGNNLVDINQVASAMNIFMNTNAQPSVTIQNNVLFNVSRNGINLSSISDEEQACVPFLTPERIQINNNKIGVRRDLSNNDNNRQGGEEWGQQDFTGYAIETCNLVAEINDNIIGNSRSETANVAIYGIQSELDIHDNDIGQYKIPSTSAQVQNMAINGWGIWLSRNYYQDNTSKGSKIYNNRIAGIKRVNVLGICNSEEWILSLESRVCGGTAILLERTNQNIVYNNILGMKDSDQTTSLENEGYGIELEGLVRGTNDDLTYQVSTENKIFNNTISYNKADGIVIPAVTDLTENHSADDSKCTTTIIYISGPPGSEASNNCSNTINQNHIFRNGRYNDKPVNGQNYNGGGIGIDLKSGSGAVSFLVNNYSEQKSGTDKVTTGTSNDTDITFNDINDLDFGGNDLLNFPVIYSANDISIKSTAEQINGTMPGSATGSYWVEVFRVRCDAENNNGNVNENDALPTLNVPSQCDTDRNQYPVFVVGTPPGTNGQGSEFLCGAYVTKPTTSDPGSWSCKPADFGITDFTGGLITSTATEVPQINVGTNFGESIVPFESSWLKYSCELGEIVIGNSNACTATGDDRKKHKPMGGLEGKIIQALGNTSEFSQDVFIPRPDVEVEKQVRLCTGTTPASCNAATFGENVNVAPGSTVEFRINVINRGTGTGNILISDPFITNLSFENCGSFSNQNELPNTGARPGPDGYCSSMPGVLNQNVSIAAGKHYYIYFSSTVETSATGILTNTVHIQDDSQTPICPPNSTEAQCLDIATVTVTPLPQDGTLVKEITSPDTDSDASKETIQSPAVATDVSYKVTLELKGITNDISNYNLTDTFPKEIKTGTKVIYKGCKFTMQINYTPASTPTECPPSASDSAIAAAADGTALVVWPGSAAEALTITPSDTLKVVVIYKGTIPANPLLITDTAKTLTNTATWRGPGVTGGLATDTTDLTISPPAQSPTVTIRHRFDTANGPANANVTSSTSSTVTKDYFITVDIAHAPTTGLEKFILTNDFVTTGTNLTSGISYSNCSIAYLPSTPTGFPTTCPDSLTGTKTLIPASLLPANITTITVKYRGTVPINAVTAPNVATIVNKATINVDLSSGVTATAAASADATLLINGNETGTSSLALDKHADNNVTTSDRSSEKVYSPGETVNYTVTITNSGNGTASGATLQDTLEKNLTNPSTLSLPSPATGGFSGNNLNVTNITIPAGNVTIGYRGTLEDESNFDLDSFDLDSTSDPKKDEDLYAPSDADIDENIDNGNNRHTREDDLLEAPDGKFVSLGDGGDIIIDLGKKVIVDGSDGDFGILELDHNSDDTDQSTESYDVYVSQDGKTYKRIDRGVTDSEQFDLSDVDMTWARFIKLEDNSSSVKANAPGADIDAICLFNIGVQLPNKANLTYNGQTITDSEYVTVDVTDVFDDQLKKTDCEEKTPAPIPTPTYIPQPPRTIAPPPTLPKTGPIGLLGVLGIIAAGVWAMRRKK